MSRTDSIDRRLRSLAEVVSAISELQVVVTAELLQILDDRDAVERIGKAADEAGKQVAAASLLLGDD